MDVYRALKDKNLDGANSLKIKKYLLGCCAKYSKYSSSGSFDKAFIEARRYMKGRATWRQLHRQEWIVEGEMFGVEYFREGITFFRLRPNIEMHTDLKRVRISERLGHKAAIEYLELLLNFVVYVLSYVYRAPRDFPREEQARFLCPILYKKYFK